LRCAPTGSNAWAGRGHALCLPSLTESERGQLEQIRGAEKRRIASEVMAVRAAADLKLSREIADREGIPIEVASG